MLLILKKEGGSELLGNSEHSTWRLCFGGQFGHKHPGDRNPSLCISIGSEKNVYDILQYKVSANITAFTQLLLNSSLSVRNMCTAGLRLLFGSLCPSR